MAPRRSRAVWIIAVVMLLPFAAGARPRGRAPVTEIRRAARADTVWVARRQVWPPAGQPGAKIVSALAWSRTSDAVAFVTERGARRELVVVLMLPRTTPAAISWPLPAQVDGRHVMWVGPRKVGVGASEVVPQMVTTFAASASPASPSASPRP